MFGCPALRTSAFLLDWLHVVDLGIGADILGNLLKLLVTKVEGRTEADRCRTLFLEMQAYYKQHAVGSRLDALNPRMYAAPGKAPKLRGKAAEVRHLVPFVSQVADRLLRREDTFEATAAAIARQLHECYTMLAADVFDSQALAGGSRRLCLLWVSLEKHAVAPNWRIKPKMHLFQELCELTQTNPSHCWVYRDEDFGGTIAQLSRRRGGHHRPHLTSRAVLAKFQAKHRVPVLR